MKKQKLKLLYKNDGKCTEPELLLRIQTIKAFKKAVSEGELRLVENKCLCHNEHPENDIIISGKDRYGIPIPQIICSKCGLVRSGLVLEEKSNRIFYEHYYRNIYLASEQKPIEALFKEEYNRGKNVLNLIKNIISLEDIKNVSEVGCGAGGCLAPFQEQGIKAVGYDFDQDYLNYGISKGISLYYGNFYELSEDASCDLILLNHVFEHFLEPIKEMSRIVPKLKKGKYLYIEVPGIFCIHKFYQNPIRYFQNAHVFNFYKDYLYVLFEQLGLHVVYGDERCRFVVQKVDDQLKEPEKIYDAQLSLYPSLIYYYLKRTDRYQGYYTMIARLKRYMKRLVSWIR